MKGWFGLRNEHIHVLYMYIIYIIYYILHIHIHILVYMKGSVEETRNLA